MAVKVMKAVEPAKLTKAGRATLDLLLKYGERRTIQPKYDGVYAQYVFEEGADDGRWRCYSRTGERMLAGEFPQVMHWLGHEVPVGARIIGELWHPDKPHAEINGEARRKKESEWLHLVLTDCILYGGKQDASFGGRQSMLRQWLEHNKTRLWHADTYVTSDEITWEELEDAARGFAANTSCQGAYDGLILRDLHAPFTEGSGTHGAIIKVKPRSSGDFKVVDTTRGVGNRKGGIGALVVDLGNGVECEVGSGLTKEQVFGSADQFIGKIVEVEYLCLTADGKLREPSFKCVRWDKTEGDTL